jgi:hypothetical protein
MRMERLRSGGRRMNKWSIVMKLIGVALMLGVALYGLYIKTHEPALIAFCVGAILIFGSLLIDYYDL